MANKPPAFPLYARDWLVDTASMPNDVQGAYMRLLCHQWIEGPMRMDMGQLGKRAGEPPRRFVKLWAEYLADKFPATDGYVANPRLETERRQQQEYREEQSRRGKVGAAKRHSQRHSGGRVVDIASAKKAPMAGA